MESLQNLGVNAKRMLGIGIAQDLLEKLGFKLELHCSELKLYKIESMRNSRFYHVIFWNDFAYFNGKEFFYSDENWQQTLFECVSEYIKWRCDESK